MKKEKIDKLQAKADQKRSNELPDQLKFLMDYPTEKISALRIRRTKIMKLCSFIAFPICFLIPKELFFVVGIFVAILYFYGMKILSSQSDLEPVITALKTTPKSERKSLIKKHHIIQSIHNYRSDLQQCLVVSILCVGAPIIQPLINQWTSN